MSENNSHHDTTINFWRIDEKQTIELIKEFPNGTMHPDSIAYSVEIPTFDCRGGIKVVWFIQHDHQERFKDLMKKIRGKEPLSNRRVKGHELLKEMTNLSSLIKGEEE
jgi:hypothetical protein